MHSLSRLSFALVMFSLCGCATQQDGSTSEPNIVVNQVIEADPITRMSFVADERTGGERVDVVFYNEGAQLNAVKPASGAENSESDVSENDR